MLAFRLRKLPISLFETTDIHGGGASSVRARFWRTARGKMGNPIIARDEKGNDELDPGNMFSMGPRSQENSYDKIGIPRAPLYGKKQEIE